MRVGTLPFSSQNPVINKRCASAVQLKSPTRLQTTSRSLQVRSSSQKDVENMRQYTAELSQKLAGVGSEMKASQAAGRMRVMAAAVEDTDKSLQELDKDTFHPFLENSDKLVVVDFYTDWCGPCKVMLPKLEELAQELKDKADIVKVNCNARNKEIGKNLNIRVAPTFFLYKNNNKVAEMTGAKLDELKELIQQNL